MSMSARASRSASEFSVLSVLKLGLAFRAGGLETTGSESSSSERTTRRLVLWVSGAAGGALDVVGTLSSDFSLGSNPTEDLRFTPR